MVLILYYNIMSPYSNLSVYYIVCFWCQCVPGQLFYTWRILWPEVICETQGNTQQLGNCRNGSDRIGWLDIRHYGKLLNIHSWDWNVSGLSSSPVVPVLEEARKKWYLAWYFRYLTSVVS